MRRRFLFIGVLVLTGIFCGGCSLEKDLIPTTVPHAKAVDPSRVQASTISFATRYIAAIMDLYDRMQDQMTTPESRMLALQCKLDTCQGALGNAVNPNPVLGLMDMTLMVTLTRVAVEEPWVTEQFGSANAAKIVATMKNQEAIIWGLAAEHFTPEQIAELHGLVERWSKEHPGQRYVGGARLADFSEAKGSQNGLVGAASSIFNLVRPDPFAGLDPAVRQVEESRVLAERMFFYLQYTPLMLSWQTDILYQQMMRQTLDQPKIVKLLEDTTNVSASTVKFTEASSKFAEYCGAFSRTIEKFRADLPGQQATLVKQVDEMLARQRDAALKQVTKDLDQLVASQREAALKQANAEIAAQRDEAIKQLSAAVKIQQDLMAKNLQGVMDSSIDRLYYRATCVVIIAAVCLLVVLVVFKLVARKLGSGV
jgi:hypothetical protein